MNIMSALRKMAINEEIDYLLLMSALKAYKRPRDKITQLLKEKCLIRVKKGLYIFGDDYARKPYVIETLANLIYGPSCISLDYALSYYGMVPERVEIITSVTDKRDKNFVTPIGTFSYRYLNKNKYPVGVTEIMCDETHPVLFATPEKALADKIIFEKGQLKLQNNDDIKYYLFEDLRIVESKFYSLNKDRLLLLTTMYKNENINRINQFLQNN